MNKDKSQMYEETISLIIIGDQFVGKTSLMKSEDILGTVGIECYKTIKQFKSSSYLIKIWDTCGQERFRSLTANYYRNADGVILVCDMTEVDSFENLKSWINSINENVQFPIPKVVIANKIDLPNKSVTSTNLKTFQRENKVEVFQCSAKQGTNINEAFEYIIKEILKNKKSKTGQSLMNFTSEETSCKC